MLWLWSIWLYVVIMIHVVARGGYRSKYFDTVLISIPWFRYRFDTILFSIPDVLKINFHNKNKLGIIEFIFQN